MNRTRTACHSAWDYVDVTLTVIHTRYPLNVGGALVRWMGSRSPVRSLQHLGWKEAFEVEEDRTTGRGEKCSRLSWKARNSTGTWAVCLAPD